MFILLNLLIHLFIIKTLLRREKNICKSICTYFFLIIFLCFIINNCKNVLRYEKAIYFIEMFSTVVRILKNHLNDETYKRMQLRLLLRIKNM